MTKYRHTTESGNVKTRTSRRAYTHVVVVELVNDAYAADGWYVMTWAGSELLAARECASWQRHGFRSKVESINGGAR